MRRPSHRRLTGVNQRPGRPLARRRRAAFACGGEVGDRRIRRVDLEVVRAERVDRVVDDVLPASPGAPVAARQLPPLQLLEVAVDADEEHVVPGQQPGQLFAP